MFRTFFKFLPLPCLNSSYTTGTLKLHCRKCQNPQKMKFSIKDFFSKCDHIRRKLRTHLLKKSLMENFIFCALSKRIHCVKSVGIQSFIRALFSRIRTEYGDLLCKFLYLVQIRQSVDQKIRKIHFSRNDTVIYTSAKGDNELQQKLPNDFNKVASWLESNDLIMNMKAGKTECMIFGTSQKIKNKELNIAYRHQSASKASTYKYLGLTLDP